MAGIIFNDMSDYCVTRNLYLNKGRFSGVPRYNFAVDFSDLYRNSIFRDLFRDYNINDDVVMLVKGFSMSEVSVNTVSKPFYKGNVNYVSEFSLEDFSIDFFPDDLSFAKKFYYRWLSLMGNGYGLNYVRGNYEYNIGVQVFNVNREVIESRIYYNCFPTSIGGYDLNKDDLDVFDSIKINFKCNGGVNILI